MADMDAFAEVAQTPGAKKPDPIVIADGIVRRFGGLTAVDVQHFEVQRHADHRTDRTQWSRQVHVLQPSDGLRYGAEGHRNIQRA